MLKKQDGEQKKTLNTNLYLYTHSHVCTPMQQCAHTREHTPMYTYILTYTPTYTHVCINTHMSKVISQQTKENLELKKRRREGL